jgi:Fe-S-cluster-containing dehydrogenase component
MTDANTQLALMIDLERCTGCKSCEAACKQTNALGPNSYRNRVIWFDEQQAGDEASLARLDFLTVTCQQCERPACLRACPVYPKAISKDPVTGVVSIDENRCTGCGECALSCPYGAIGYNAEQHHAVKCDLCAERRARDLGPACAFVCPTRAISFDNRAELLEQARRDQREILDTDHFLQQPATIYLRRPRDAGANAPAGPARSTPALMSDHSSRGSLQPGIASGSYRRADKTELNKQPERVVPGACNICFNGCPIKFHLRGDKVVNIYGNDEDPVFQGRVCPKSQMTLQMYDNPHRLTTPLKRVGKRGSDRFEAISWEQALGEIAHKLEAVREQYGSEALAIQSGSRTGVLNIIGAIPIFAKLWGTANVAATEPYCDMGKGIALSLTQGTGVMASVYTEEDIGSAEAYVYIGDNQAETRPVNFGMTNDWRLKHGARMIAVDPRLTATASKADDWLPIRSGHGARSRHHPLPVRQRFARPGLLRAVDRRLARVARFRIRPGLRSRLVRPGYRPAAGTDRNAGANHRRRRRLHDFPQPRHQPAHQLGANQPRIHVRRGDDRQLGAPRRRLFQRLVGNELEGAETAEGAPPLDASRNWQEPVGLDDGHARRRSLPDQGVDHR